MRGVWWRIDTRICLAESLCYSPESITTFLIYCCSVTKSCLTLHLHGLQHTRLPRPSLSPRVCSNSCSLSQWCHPTISSSVILTSSCSHSCPALGSFTVSQLFVSDGQMYWSFSISPSNEYSGLISSRIDWFHLLAVQGTLKSLQKASKSSESSKASILWLYWSLSAKWYLCFVIHCLGLS